ncbi:hypothetical protein AB0K45_11985, partial [Micrococcus luteus]|uniref:hypothetical protein n=1 Tax=Micrococcus luteus TaxID=1270 RepID=UPI00344583B7
VHRLSDRGAVVTHAAQGLSKEGFHAEWRDISVGVFDDGLLSRTELFDAEDLDAALARFDELTAPSTRLKNNASHVFERYLAAFTLGDWTALAEMMVEGIVNDDRRRVVNGGAQRGRDAVLANMRAVADVGVTNIECSVLATRGERLALGHYRVSGGTRPEAFGSQVLIVVEVDADNRFAAGVSFDVDDLDAAVAELDARYCAGEAGDRAATFRVIVDGLAGIGRNEVPPMTSDFADVDHRAIATIEAGGLAGYLRVAFADSVDNRMYVEEVHRLSESGSVVTHVAQGRSIEGLAIEWRVIDVLTIDGDRFSRCELFDERDLPTALARFDELNRPVPHLGNRASELYEQLWSFINTRDWDAVGQLLADDVEIDLKELADIGATASSNIIAVRGERLALMRILTSNSDLQVGDFDGEFLVIVEINVEDRVSAGWLFDVENVDAAFAELEARYAAGEAKPYERVWAAVTSACVRLNLRDVPEHAADWVALDHRKAISFAPGAVNDYIGATMHDFPDYRIRIEKVHRLSEIGAVITFTSSATSQAGFDAEWRMLQLLTVSGDELSRLEMFDEEDLDAALVRFDEMVTPRTRLENTASRMHRRYTAFLPDRNWTAMAEMIRDDIETDDRRRVVSGGVQYGRDAQESSMRAAADVGVRNLESTVLAVRGDRVALLRARVSGDHRPEAFGLEMLIVEEVDVDGRCAAAVLFDPEDLDAAVAELDARYSTGEAKAHSRTWARVTATYATLNNRELGATTENWVNVDHRTVTPIRAGDLTAYLKASWDLMPSIHVYVETVHRLNDRGAVLSHVTHGLARDGFDAAWREVALMTFDGDLISRCELFDDDGVDAALARFDELTLRATRPTNTATRVNSEIVDTVNRRDVAGYLSACAADARYVDRRRGFRSEGPIDATFTEALLLEGPKSWQVDNECLGTRGDRLALIHYKYLDVAEPGCPVVIDLLGVLEVNRGQLMTDLALFDPDDLDTAFTELDNRYLTTLPASHARIWSLVTRTYAGFNRKHLSRTTPDW